jgi:hypothetical protein
LPADTGGAAVTSLAITATSAPAISSENVSETAAQNGQASARRAPRGARLTRIAASRIARIGPPPVTASLGTLETIQRLSSMSTPFPIEDAGE